MTTQLDPYPTKHGKFLCKTLCLCLIAIFALYTLPLSAAPYPTANASRCTGCDTGCKECCKDPNSSGRVAAGIIAALVLGGGALAVLLHSSSSGHSHTQLSNSATNTHS